AILVIGVGVAFSTSVAVLEAFAGRGRGFVRTPKFGIAGGTGTWRGKEYGERALWGGAAEIALALYCAVATLLIWAGQQYAMVPFLALYTLGFLTVGTYTIVQSLAIRLGSGQPGGGRWSRSKVAVVRSGHLTPHQRQRYCASGIPYNRAPPPSSTWRTAVLEERQSL